MKHKLAAAAALSLGMLSQGASCATTVGNDQFTATVGAQATAFTDLRLEDGTVVAGGGMSLYSLTTRQFASYTYDLTFTAMPGYAITGFQEQLAFTLDMEIGYATLPAVYVFFNHMGHGFGPGGPAQVIEDELQGATLLSNSVELEVAPGAFCDYYADEKRSSCDVYHYDYAGIRVDDLSITPIVVRTAAIPEPLSLAMFLAGIAGLTLAKRRRSMWVRG